MNRSPTAARLMAPLMAALCVAASCDTTAFFAIDNRPLTDMEVVSVFPAHLDAKGVPVRVCGVPLDGETALEANGLEVVVNFVAAGVKKTECAYDRDNSIHPGDEISLRPFIDTTEHATVGPGQFDLAVQCIEPRAAPSATCSLPSTKGDTLAQSIRYERIARRCGTAPLEESRISLALVVDNSGSTIGFVDRVNLHEDQPGRFEPPNPLAPSDPMASRTWAALRLLEQLNEADRIIGYWYDEASGIRVAASNNRSCQGGGRDGLRCNLDSDCKGGWCKTGGAPEGNTLSSKSLSQWEKAAFGASPLHRRLLDTDLSGTQKFDADGRAPLWPAVGRAYTFLRDNADRNRQMVILADGPDTCSPSEDFDFAGSDGTCRLPCAIAGPDFQVLRKQMHEEGWPVPLHFIQFQSAAYRAPDAAMIEMACRSGGTYQFVNAQEISLSGPALREALELAVVRVRRSLSGNWRMGYAVPALTAKHVLERGSALAIAGRLGFDSSRFACPELGISPVTMAHFTNTSTTADDRLVFRTPCTNHADCGGSDACGAGHCTPTGMCVAKAAADLMPCQSDSGAAQVCCAGGCSANCAGACKP